MWKLDAAVECFIGWGGFSVVEKHSSSRRVSLALRLSHFLSFALLRVP